MGIVVDYLGNIGLDVVKDRLTDSADEAVARERLKKYLERQKKINYFCSKNEEIDFEGLAIYIQDNLIEDFKKRIFGAKRERKEARKTILEKATVFAQANTKLSAKRAQRMVEEAMDILYRFYRGKTNRELLFVATQIEETFENEIKETCQELSTKIAQMEAKVGAANLLTLDSNVLLAQSGQVSQVESNISAVLKAISSTHKLYPYYGYKMEDQEHLISIPLTEDATKLYPPRFNVTASSVRLGDVFINKIDEEVLSQSYRHQIPISMDVVTAKKYLGNVLDPIQREADEITGTHVVMAPPSFPPAFACNFSIDDTIHFDYVLLRTKEIQDDGTILITNEEQENRHFDVSLSYNPKSTQFFINLHLISPTNSELLHFYQFITAANHGGELKIKALAQNEIISSGLITRSDILDYSEQIQFLTMIDSIEKYFHFELSIPNSISHEEYNIITHIFSLVKDHSFTGSWTTMDFAFCVTEEVKQQISELTDHTYTLTYAYHASIEIFGQSFTLPVRRRVECAMIYDLLKTKKKAEILDYNDLMKLKIVPGGDKKVGLYYDSLASEDDDYSVMFAEINR